MPPKKTRKAAPHKAQDNNTRATSRTNVARKRKASDTGPAGPGSESGTNTKRPRKAAGQRDRAEKISAHQSTSKSEAPIVINRAPVLELWGACVASFLHPELSWNACLSIGSSIATITAISKGRSIGKIAKPDPDAPKQKKKEDKKDGEDELPSVRVMGFPMTLRDDAVIVKGKPRPGRELSLARRFGTEENLALVKSTMVDALETWRGDEDELDKAAFHMYEQFRPEVARGQQGWGRKGELYLSQIDSVVRK